VRIINTNSLTLEPQVAGHAEEMFVVLSDPAIYEYENEPPPSLEWALARSSEPNLQPERAPFLEGPSGKRYITKLSTHRSPH
jgi:hypothetical protein